MAVVTPTDRPKSVHNRCVIELFSGVVCVVTLPFWHFCWCRGYCHRTVSDLFLFLLRSKTRQRTTLLLASYLNLRLSIGKYGQLHTSIYDKRDDFHFPITNCPFLSSNIPASSAYGVSSHSLYDMPGLAPRMKVLFWGRHEFQKSFSNRDASRNTWNRHWRSFMVDTEILSNNTKFLSNEC